MELIIGTTPEIIAQARSIRYAVFTEEQGIPSHMDHDGKDEASFHALVTDGGKPVATARLYSGNGSHAVMARVAVMREYRGRGIGTKIITAMLRHARSAGLQCIEIHAHGHLRVYYEQLGFQYIKDYQAVAGHRLIEMRYYFQ